MRPNPRLSRVCRTLRAGLAPTVALWTIACGSGQDALAPSPRSTGLVVSDPLAITAATPAAIRASVQQLAPGVNGVTYVSIQPGTFPGRSAASIANRRISGSVPVQVALVNGGLDPFPIPATAGDTVVVEIASSGSQPAVTLARVVPTALQPNVVRTGPAPGIRDVALLDVMTIVFTEPMNRATINGTNISLLRDGARVAGQVALADDGFTATFRPDAALAPGTQYVLTVGAGVAGLDGLQLGTPVTVAFTTGTASGAAVALRFNVQPVGALVGQVMAPPVVVAANDASGNQATGFTGSITVAIGSNPGGGSLSGTTTRAGFATFDDLRIDRVGSGYTLVATASGLPRATSAPFDVVPALAGTDRIALYTFSHGIGLIGGAGGGTAPLVKYLGGGTWADAPAWSPDGTKLAFVNDTNATIYVMNADGSAVRSLNQHGSQPAWSPDGTKIAFARASSPDSVSIYVMNADGSGAARLTQDGAEPAWSPDGTKIAFARGGSGIYVMNADGSGVPRLTQAGTDPAWSPDGTKIAFTRFVATSTNTEGFRDDIWVMNADGSGQTNLTGQHPEPISYHPTWSPDGRRIAFASTYPNVGPYQIYVMNPDGSGTAVLGPGPDNTQTTWSSFNPAWAPR